MKEIVPGIFTWSKFSEPHGFDFNGFLVVHPAGNLCIDPVQPTEADLEALAEKGAARILITNRNHSRAANLVRARLGARTAIHAEDAAHARAQGTEIDDDLPAGLHVGPLRVVGASGKSPGEVALFWRDRRILFAGDVVIGKPPGRCGLVAEKVMDDPAGLRRSLRRLLELDFDTLLMGDGVSILGDAKERLRELTETFAD